MARLADTAFVGGSLFTLDPAQPVAQACAVRGDRLIAVGSEEDVRAVCGPSTEVVDVRGGTVLPGFQDSHVHPPMAGVEMLRCNLTEVASRAEYLAIVAEYAASHPEVEWIRGGGWSMPAFPGGLPTAADLDSVVGNRPVYLPNRDHHSAWVSSRALELAGITTETPDPVDGRIERDGRGRPTGALHDGAMWLVEDILPPFSPADYVDGVLAAQAYLHSLGITAWQDAWVTTTPGANTVEAYLSVAGDGRLTARVVAAQWWERGRGVEQVEGFLAWREAAAEADRLRASTVKIMQDGVCETFTAAMLNPYLDAHGHATDKCGLSFVDPEDLKEALCLLDGQGFQVHVHAIGDRAVREALDAVEAARTANGPNENRHHLAHLQVVHPDDLDRFARLGVVATFQPLWACADAQMVELTMPFLGPERSSWQYPIGSLRARGARLAFGSDWPVSSPNPLEEMYVAVHREEPPSGTGGGEGGLEGPFLPDERISLQEAVRSFTLGSAYVNHLEADTGSLKVGKFADLAVLDRNLFEVDEADGGIAGARVVMTVVGGDVVYEGSGL